MIKEEVKDWRNEKMKRKCEWVQWKTKMRQKKGKAESAVFFK